MSFLFDLYCRVLLIGVDFTWIEVLVQLVVFLLLFIRLLNCCCCFSIELAGEKIGEFCIPMVDTAIFD